MDSINKGLGFNGLTNAEVERSRLEHGKNKVELEKVNPVLHFLSSLVSEPMVLILFLASALYFLSGEIWNGCFLLFAVGVIGLVTLYQENRSNKALSALDELSQPYSRVIRNGVTVSIKQEEIVQGDLILIEEGDLIPADGTVLKCNDLLVDESLLTGESVSCEKKLGDYLYSGTVLLRGLSVMEVVNLGGSTKLGEISKAVGEIDHTKTSFEEQIDRFVKKMAIVGVAVFFLVLGFYYLSTFDFVRSLLKSLTLALSLLPEEIPVAFTTFMALGMWKLSKKGFIPKHIKTVEALGSATVICSDKTGTLTENEMSLTVLYSLDTDSFCDLRDTDLLQDEERLLVETAKRASEIQPYDPMEVSINKVFEEKIPYDLDLESDIVKEYSLSGVNPMMTHVSKGVNGLFIASCKGTVEALLNVTNLSEISQDKILEAQDKLTTQGYRVLAVGLNDKVSGDLPNDQTKIRFGFLGLIAFYDPPKKKIKQFISDINQAGVKVKIVTGDYGKTAGAIAKEVGIEGYDLTITGEEVMGLSDLEMQEVVNQKNVFSRMQPDAKVRVINALKKNGEVVAMLGDGVNDGPALKSSHIGVAMGGKGTEVAKRTSDLIIIDDDLSRILDAIAMGRRINSNLKKAIQYIISIHIPIILVVAIPLFLGWEYPSLFSPIHVVVLELIMGPTCSIVFENEPLEPQLMNTAPPKYSKLFFKGRELFLSLVQGIAITSSALFIYKYSNSLLGSADDVRTALFTSLIFSNIFLTFVNRSFFHSILKTMRFKNRFVPFVISVTLVLSFIMVYVPGVNTFFGFNPLNIKLLLLIIFTSFVSVIWLEAYKWVKRNQASKVKFICVYK